MIRNLASIAVMASISVVVGDSIIKSIESASPPSNNCGSPSGICQSAQFIAQPGNVKVMGDILQDAGTSLDILSIAIADDFCTYEGVCLSLVQYPDGGSSGGGSQFVGWYDGGSGDIQTAGGAVVIDAAGDVTEAGAFIAGGNSGASVMLSAPFGPGYAFITSDAGQFYIANDPSGQTGAFIIIANNDLQLCPFGGALNESTCLTLTGVGTAVPTVDLASQIIRGDGGCAIGIGGIPPIACIRETGQMFIQPHVYPTDAVQAAEISCPYGTGTLNADGGGGFVCLAQSSGGVPYITPTEIAFAGPDGGLIGSPNSTIALTGSSALPTFLSFQNQYDGPISSNTDTFGAGAFEAEGAGSAIAYFGAGAINGASSLDRGFAWSTAGMAYFAGGGNQHDFYVASGTTISSGAITAMSIAASGNVLMGGPNTDTNQATLQVVGKPDGGAIQTWESPDAGTASFIDRNGFLNESGNASTALQTVPLQQLSWSHDGIILSGWQQSATSAIVLPYAGHVTKLTMEQNNDGTTLFADGGMMLLSAVDTVNTVVLCSVIAPCAPSSPLPLTFPCSGAVAAGGAVSILMGQQPDAGSGACSTLPPAVQFTVQGTYAP